MMFQVQSSNYHQLDNTYHSKKDLTHDMLLGQAD